MVNGLNDYQICFQSSFHDNVELQCTTHTTQKNGVNEMRNAEDQKLN